MNAESPEYLTEKDILNYVDSLWTSAGAPNEKAPESFRSGMLCILLQGVFNDANNRAPQVNNILRVNKKLS